MNAKSLTRTKTFALMALFIALSFVGSYLRIFGSIAFDSLPGFLAAMILGPIPGAIIGFLGHLFTALLSGFPLSPPLHLVIAGTMALTMYIYGLTYRILQKKCSETITLVITVIVGIVFNAPVSLAFSMLTLWLMAGREAALGLLALLPVLLIASAANVILSVVIFKALEKIWKNYTNGARKNADT